MQQDAIVTTEAEAILAEAPTLDRLKAQIIQRGEAARSREAFEEAAESVDRILAAVPRGVRLDDWWLIDDGQTLAGLLWSLVPLEDRLPSGGAIAYLGGDFKKNTYERFRLRLKRAYDSGRVRRFRIPENAITRRKDSKKGSRSWYFYKPELDALREKP